MQHNILENRKDKTKKLHRSQTRLRILKQQQQTTITEIYLAGFHPISVRARNNISSADASSNIRVLHPVSLEWLKKPPAKVDVGAEWNFSVITNGTNVTVRASFGDGSPTKKEFHKSDQTNAVTNFFHT